MKFTSNSTSSWFCQFIISILKKWKINCAKNSMIPVLQNLNQTHLCTQQLEVNLAYCRLHIVVEHNSPPWKNPTLNQQYKSNTYTPRKLPCNPTPPSPLKKKQPYIHLPNHQCLSKRITPENSNPPRQRPMFHCSPLLRRLWVDT